MRRRHHHAAHARRTKHRPRPFDEQAFDAFAVEDRSDTAWRDIVRRIMHGERIRGHAL